MDLKRIFGKYFKLFVYLVIVVLINLVGATLFFRLDLTANNLYTISEGSREVVSTLSEPLTINVFFTKDLPAPHNNTERYLHDLLEEYARNANRFFNYQFFDVDPETEGVSAKARENREIANNYGIRPVQIQLIEKDEVKFMKAYMGLVIIHGDQIERIPTITTTEGLEYKLTTAIQKLNNKVSALLNLTDKIDITLYMSSSLKQVAPYMGLKDLPQYPQEVEKVVKKLNTKTYDKLDYKYVDPTAQNIPNAELEKHQLTALKWPAIEKANIPAGYGAMGMVMSYQSKQLEIPLLKVIRIPIIGTQYDLTEIGQLEDLISDNLEALVDINEKLGYLADHGALNISSFTPPRGMGMQPQGATELGKLLSNNYSLTPVNLKEEGVPEGLKCLIIARPTEKFSDYALWQIDQALMRGTNLMILPDPFNEVSPPRQQQFQMNQGPMFIPADTGINKLLSHWGVSVNQALVMDKNCYKQRMQQQFGGGESSLYFAPIIKNKNINDELPFMKNIKGLVALKIAPLALEQKQLEKNKLTAHRLFASSSESWEMRGRINLNPMFIRPPTDEKEFASMPLAYLLEGEFSSYFKGKPMPEKPAEKRAEEDSENKTDAIKPEEDAAKDEKSKVDLSKIETQSRFLEKSPPGKIFVMAASEMLQDNVIDSEGQSPNAMFILNVVDALNNRADIAAMRSKVQRFNPLNETSAGLKTFTKAFNIVGLPILVVFFGLVVWMRRHARKKRIQMLFP